MKIIGIIPARGGSKGVKDKNIKLLNGKPLIKYTIEPALDSSMLTDLVVSSDSKKILDIAKEFNDIHILSRESALATDNAPMSGVILDVMKQLKIEKDSNDIIVLLQPTCPFRTSNLIDDAINFFVDSESDSLISVYNVGDTHPARMYSLRDNFLNSLDVTNESTNRQDLTDIFHRNGYFYITYAKNFYKKKSFYQSRSLPYIMKKDGYTNIDDANDFLLSEFIIKNNTL